MIITLFSSNEPRIIRSRNVYKVKRVEFEDLFHLAIFFAYISGLAFPHFF